MVSYRSSLNSPAAPSIWFWFKPSELLQCMHARSRISHFTNTKTNTNRPTCIESSLLPPASRQFAAAIFSLQILPLPASRARRLRAPPSPDPPSADLTAPSRAPSHHSINNGETCQDALPALSSVSAGCTVTGDRFRPEGSLPQRIFIPVVENPRNPPIMPAVAIESCAPSPAAVQIILSLHRIITRSYRPAQAR